MPRCLNDVLSCFSNFLPQHSLFCRTWLIVVVLLAGPGREQIAAQALMSEVDPMNDPEAMLFVNSCLQCHRGVLNKTELIDTHNRTVQNLNTAVRRMQQYTGPLTEQQISDLIELMKDPDYIFRIEEAELSVEDTVPVTVDVDDVLSSADLTANLYINKCASCHTVGGNGSSGGDLAHTAQWQVPQLRTAVKRMELRVGPMSDEQVTSLVELLKDTSAKQRLAAAGLKSISSNQLSPSAPVIQRGTPAAVSQRGLMSFDGPPVGIIITVLALVAAALISFAIYLGMKDKQ